MNETQSKNWPPVYYKERSDYRWWLVHGRWKVHEEMSRVVDHQGPERRVLKKHRVYVTTRNGRHPVRAMFTPPTQVARTFGAFVAGCVRALRPGKAAVREDVDSLMRLMAELMGVATEPVGHHIIDLDIDRVRTIMAVGGKELVRRVHAV